MKIKLIMVSVLSVLSSVYLGLAYAQESPLYIGASYGSSEFSTGVSATTGTARLDEDDNGFKIYAGYDINSLFSVEAHYVNLGEASLKGNTGDQFTYRGVVSTFPANNVNIAFEGKSIGISGMFHFAASDTVNPFVKVGLHRWDVDASISSSAGNASLNDDGTDIFYGIGVGVSVNKQLSLRGEFESYDFDGNDVNYLSLGVVYSF